MALPPISRTDHDTTAASSRPTTGRAFTHATAFFHMLTAPESALMPPFLASLMRVGSPRDAAALASASREGYRAFAPLLPLVRTPATSPLVQVHEKVLLAQLQSSSASQRRDAQSWLSQWCEQFGNDGFATGTACRLLESLSAYGPQLERRRDPVTREVTQRVVLPQALKEMLLSPDRLAARLAESLVHRYCGFPEPSVHAILQDNGAVPVTLDGQGRARISEHCRAWLRVEDPFECHDLVQRIALGVRDLEVRQLTTDTVDSAFARFLRSDPGRDQPWFADALTAVMSQPEWAGLGSLRSDAFVDALTRPQADGPGLPMPLVMLALARSTRLPEGDDSDLRANAP